MKCPICKKGELKLYRETEKTYQYQITKKNKIYKKPFSEKEFDTEKDYLECENTEECGEYFNYDINDEGVIIKNSVVKRLPF